MSPKKTRKPQHRLQRGVTLVLITLLGLIMAAVGLGVIPTNICYADAKRDTAMLDIGNIHKALELYESKTGHFPDTATGLRALVELRALEQLPVDPWGHEYVYVNEGGKPLVTSHGADGVPGGEGLDADISSLDLDKGSVASH